MTPPTNQETIAAAIAAEKRYDLLAAGVSGAVMLVMAVAAPAIQPQLGPLAPFLGLAVMYALHSRRRRKARPAELAAAALDLERDRSPWTWVAVFAIVTWGTAELATGLVGIGLGAAVAIMWEGLLGPAEIDLIFTETYIQAEFLIGLVGTLASLVVAIPAGRSLGMREAVHPYRWLLVAATVSRLLALLSAVAASIAWLEGDVGSALGLVVVNAFVALVLFGFGSIGVARGRRHRTSYRASTLYRSLPAEDQAAVLELLAEAAQRVTAGGSGSEPVEAGVS